MLACTGSVAAAVQAHDKAAKLAESDAKADRWETWARSEHARDERAYAQFNDVARRYRTLARRAERSQRLLLREIAATRSLRRTVVAGSPIVTYVRIRKLVPVTTAPAAISSTQTATTAASSRAGTKQKPHAATKPKKPTAKRADPPAGSTSPESAPAAGASPSPAAPGAGSAAGGTTTPGGDGAGGATPPPALAPPANTVLPSIIGLPQSGKTFSASPGSWTGDPTSFQYQWQRCDAGGAGCVVVGNAQSYTCVPADIDKTLRVAVEAKNAAGSAIAVSAASPKTKPS